MKRVLSIIIISLFVIHVNGNAQVKHTVKKYSIDSTIAGQVKKFRVIDSGALKNSMNISVYSNGRIFFNQHGPLDGYTKTSISNDTIYITGHMEGEIGYGFLLALFGDSCIAAGFAYSDSTIYKYSISDTSHVAFITPPNKTQKIILSKKPSFKKGETITGLIELESTEFYYYIKKPVSSFTIKLKAYFRTAAVEVDEVDKGGRLPG